METTSWHRTWIHVSSFFIWTSFLGIEHLVSRFSLNETMQVHRACLILRDFALSRRLLARLRRANNLSCCVKNALSAFFTQQDKLGERRRREQALVMAIR